jgi:hypothetical protein
LPSAFMDVEDKNSIGIRLGTYNEDLGLIQNATTKMAEIITPPNVKFSNFSASVLSDDRWICPICLDIYTNAVEISCCNNLFCDACIKRTK